MSDRPDVDLGVIRRQLSAITNYLKMNVWKRKEGMNDPTTKETTDKRTSI
jgi:hypothetical protein